MSYCNAKQTLTDKPADMRVTFTHGHDGTSVIVSCELGELGNPVARDFCIYINDVIIWESKEGKNFTHFDCPCLYDFGSNFTCKAGNYVGNTTASKLYWNICK